MFSESCTLEVGISEEVNYRFLSIAKSGPSCDYHRSSVDSQKSVLTQEAIAATGSGFCHCRAGVPPTSEVPLHCYGGITTSYMY